MQITQNMIQMLCMGRLESDQERYTYFSFSKMFTFFNKCLEE